MLRCDVTSASVSCSLMPRMKGIAIFFPRRFIHRNSSRSPARTQTPQSMMKEDRPIRMRVGRGSVWCMSSNRDESLGTT